MKTRLLPLLAALLLLSACGGGKSNQTPPPSSAPSISPAPSTVPTPTPEPEPEAAWWEDIDPEALPETEGERALLNGVPCYLVKTLEDVSLYCGVDGEAGGWLLRRGDAVQYCSAPMTDLPETAPRLQWGDFDGDGAEELLVICYPAPQSADLHIFEWSDGWTDRHFGPEVYAPLLLDVIEYQYVPRTATVTCEGETVSYTPGPEEAGRIGLWDSFGDLLFYRVQGTGITAVFGVGVNVNGEARYFANLTAEVQYDGTQFSLLNFQLSATGGV